MICLILQNTLGLNCDKWTTFSFTVILKTLKVEIYSSESSGLVMIKVLF